MTDLSLKLMQDIKKIQQEIVNFLLQNSSSLSINEMQTIHEFTDGNYKVYTYQLDLIGNFLVFNTNKPNLM
jgi:hypothetical protein